MMDEPTIQFSTVSDPMKWDSEGAGVICFASPEDAKRAEVIFNSVQGAAYKAGREAGMREAAKDAERYRWLRDQVSHADSIPIAQCVWKLGSDPHGEWANLIDGSDMDKHIDAARGQP